MLVIISSVHSIANDIVAEIVSEAATAEIEAAGLILAIGLVAYAVLTRVRNPRSPVVVAFGGAIGLLTLAVAVRTDGWLTGVDGPITGWFVEQRTATLDAIATAVTTVSGPLETAALGLVIAAVLAWRTKRFGPASILLGTVAFAAIVCTIAKLVVQRDRPPASIQLLSETDYSFPSGHVTGTATLLLMTALVAARSVPKLRATLFAVALAITALVASSRLYLGVHWFTDVCAGLLLAVIMTIVGALVLSKSAYPIAFHAHTREEVSA